MRSKKWICDLKASYKMKVVAKVDSFSNFSTSFFVYSFLDDSTNAIGTTPEIEFGNVFEIFHAKIFCYLTLNFV